MKKIKLNVSTGALLLLAALYFFLPLNMFAALLLSAVAHESGHLLALKLTGQQVTGLSADGGGATISRRGQTGRVEEAFCAVAGPAAGIVYALAASLLGKVTGSTLLTSSAGMSIVLSAFNMLPALPLDGGRIMVAALGDKSSANIGLVVSCIVLLAGIALITQGLGSAFFVAGIWLMLGQVGL